MKSLDKSFFLGKSKGKLAALLSALLLLLVLIPALTCLHLPLTEDERFTSFTEQIFRSEICGNTLNLHYTLADPGAFGIKNYPITLGTMDQNTHTTSAAAGENYLNRLSRFSREELSPKNRLTYDILVDYLKTSREGAPFYLYQEPLSPTLGIQAQLPVLLAEYTFRTKQDIEDYLALLTQLPDYFQSILAFEQEKSRAGLFMSDDCVKNILKQCDSFVKSGEDNYLKQLFEEQIDSFTNLTADEKISYKQQNQQILSGYVIPAYQELMAGLANLLGTGKNPGGLCHLPEGKAYYEYLVRSTTGDASPLSRIEDRIQQEISAVYKDIQSLLRSDAGLSTASLTQENAPAPEEILSTLQELTAKDFPTPLNVSCQIKYVHDSLEDYLSPAFYLTPPIDDTENNVIYINRASDYNPLELYTTLAHEGYPGHLYQTVTFESANQDPLRSILNFGGYTEGWATYVEMYAYGTWQENPALASLYQKDRSLMLGIASLLDIGIHYHGYTKAQVAQFLNNFGIKEQTSHAMYNTILEAHDNYLKYYVGYLNFKDLSEELKEHLGSSFSLKEYHARVLAIGPCSFPVLKKYLTDQEYLSEAA